jgi:hypothetical protein
MLMCRTLSLHNTTAHNYFPPSGNSHSQI